MRKHLRKFVTLSLVLALLLAMTMGVSAATTDHKEHDPHWPKCPSARFIDVNPDRWYHWGIDYCVANGIMVGTTENTFAPNEWTNRAQLVTMLWRHAGSPEPVGTSPFEDVPAGRYYTKAVAWAWENNVVKGTTETTFSPNDELTRQDLAVLLYRYTKDVLKMDVSKKANLDRFPDAEKISDYAKEAVAWAVAQEMIFGKKHHNHVIMDPKSFATRAEVANIFARYCVQVLFK